MILNKKIFPPSIRNIVRLPDYQFDKWIEECIFANSFSQKGNLPFPEWFIVCILKDGTSFYPGSLVLVVGKTNTIQKSNKRKLTKMLICIFLLKNYFWGKMRCFTRKEVSNWRTSNLITKKFFQLKITFIFQINDYI